MYQCLSCEEPMIKYIDERRQAIAHLYRYSIPLDQMPDYCSLCHFLTAVEDKLTAHVKGYSKHVDAAKALEKSGVPQENFLRDNPNPIHRRCPFYTTYTEQGGIKTTLAEGQFKQDTYWFDWGKASTVNSGPNPKDSRTCTLSRIIRSGVWLKYHQCDAEM